MKILILKQRIRYPIQDDIEKYRQWLSRLGFKPEIEEREVDLGIFKFKEWDPKRHYYGTDESKQQIREEGLVLPLTHKIVVFLYDVYASGWVDDSKKTLANWTFYRDLNGSAFMEIGVKSWYDDGDWVFKLLRHETCHAFNAILRWQGTDIGDALDALSGTKGDEEAVRMVLENYRPFMKKIDLDYSIGWKIGVISGLIAFFQDLLKKNRNREREEMRNLIAEIALQEGADFKTLLAVLDCESGLNPKAKFTNRDGTIDRGIAQLNSYWYRHVSDADAYNPRIAIRIAAKRFKQGFAKDWVCYSTGKYKQFLI